MRTSFTHSDGWKWKLPILIQRRAPSTLLPTSLTATSEMSEMP